MQIGVVLRRSPGVTQWARWSWRAVAALPGAGSADWVLLRQDGDVSEFHAATHTMELHGADTESYLHGLHAQLPCLYVVMRATEDDQRPFDVVLVTASPYEAQDYCDSGEDVVEKIVMPEVVKAWVRDFVTRYHTEEVFKKRKRDKKDVTRVEDGVGDPRIKQLVDVYRSPVSAKKERLQ
ncbi:DUF3305 domain-containing protein [Aliisedimentitalea scapharcae]|uniref:DUF3305 domain-containing protein n=1 Tax=Aliisedimentitalea scapharcae TaxID=1524259 RepID=A0ABZ2XNA7_9RHOB|nr:DUF3305 domain-containing protein [Rhodobacteraceae bacterium M382]